MSAILRRRALAIAAAAAISTAALVLSFRAAHAQEAAKPVPQGPAAAAAPGPAATTPAAGATPANAPAPSGSAATPPANPQLPEVKILQDKQPPKAVEDAAPVPKKKPAPVVEDDEPAPPPKVKKKKAAKPAATKPVAAAKPKSSPPPAAEPEPSSQAAAAAPAALVNATGTYNPALDLGDIDLPPGTIITTAGPVDGYRALSATSSTKTATPLERLPQSIQVVPRQVLDDQRSVSVEEAVRNVSGVQGTSHLQTPAYESTKIRGFAAEQWLDGLTVYYNVGDRDALANVERVEVLKGPSAILYGGGAGAPIGGAVNVISKLPKDIASGAFGVTVGTHGYVSPFFDINQPVSKDGTVLFRMTGEYTAADSFIDVLDTDRYSLNPTLTLTNKSDTTLTVQGRLSKWEQQEYQGLPATGTVAGAFRIDPDLFIGPADIPKSTSEVKSVTVTLDHKFSSMLSASVKSRFGHAEFAERAQSLSGADGFQANSPFIEPSSWGLSNILLYQEQDEFTISPTMTARFGLGPTQNTLLTGADYSRLSDVGFLTGAVGSGGFVDLTNPAFPVPYAEPPKGLFTSFIDSSSEYVTKGLFVQLQSSVYDTVHLLGGLRLANVEINYTENTLGSTTTTDTTRLLPRIGAVVDVTSFLSLYASYSEGLKGVPYIVYAGAPKPEESLQRELGAKFNFNDVLTGTVSYFEIERSNVPLGFPAVATGEQAASGFEVDGLWQPNRNWQVLANYAFIDAELVEPAAGAAAGNQLTGVPEHSGRFWVNYAFDTAALAGWSVGAGIYASSGAPVNLANTFFTKSYFTVDAKVAYDTEHWSAALNVKNLTGEDYFVP